ncbi:MAG: ATP-binding protein, partial [Planctomycetota bacterium]
MQQPDSGAIHRIMQGDVKCDSYILSHVVSNLLSNARKYTSRGSIVLSFHGEVNGKLVFRVADTGRGLPKAIRDRLFRTEVTTGDNRGTGLGLPSCGLFCKAAGGYARLVNTCLQDDGGHGGFTIFEFAVEGSVVQVEHNTLPSRASNTKLDAMIHSSHAH